VDDKQQKLGKLPPERILSTNKQNFKILLSEFIGAEMSEGFLGSRLKITVGARKNDYRLWLHMRRSYSDEIA